MAIDTEAKRRSVSNVITRMSGGLQTGGGIDTNERPNLSFMYGFLTYTGEASVPTEDLMVMYPIQPTASSNIGIYQKDDRAWEDVQKSATVWRDEIVSLRFRIFTKASMKTFYDFHVDNINVTMILNIPGVQPFIRAAESNVVRILSFTAPQQIDPKNYEITVTYRNILIT